MPDTYTRRIALSQTGYSSGVGNWTTVAVGTNIPFTTSSRVALVFNFQTPGASDVGSPFDLSSGMTPPRALDAPLVVSLGTFPLDLTAASTTLTYDVLLVTEPALADFSAASGPYDRATTTLVTGRTLAAADGSVAQTFTTAAADLLRAHAAGRASWNGKLGVLLEATSGGPAELEAMNLVLWTMTLMQSFTGLQGGPSGPGVRAVRDGRFGFGAFNTQLQRDGDNPALYVRAHDVDPEDPAKTYRPRPGEGSYDDGIPG